MSVRACPGYAGSVVSSSEAACQPSSQHRRLLRAGGDAPPTTRDERSRPQGRELAEQGSVSVGVRFTDVPGDFRFHAVDGKPRFEPGKADEPDFELTLFPGAVHDICGKSSADVGDLTVLFLQHIFANEPDQKILVKVHSGLVKLTMRGWLRVVVAGCPKLIRWLATPDAARPLRAGRLRSQRARPGLRGNFASTAGGNPYWTRFPRDGARTRSICAGAAGRSLRRAAPQEGRISELLSPRPPPASSRPA